MAAKNENLTVLSALIADSTSAADAGVLVIPFKCRIYRSQLVVTGTEATALVVKFDGTQNASGTRGDGDVGAITLPASNVQGSVYYDLVARGDIFEAGDIITVQVTTGSTADKAVYAQVLVDYIPEVEGNDTNLVETA